MEHDLNNINDFTNICSSGNICPNASIEMRNLTRDNIIHKPFLDHSVQLCNANNTDLLTLLTGIHDKINNNMVTIGDNVPIVKNKINKVISEWPHEVTYDTLFQNNDKRKFNYSDIIDCNNRVLNINTKMDHLKQLIQNDKDDIYSTIEDIERDCDECNQKIYTTETKLDDSIEDYEVKYPQILMDLSTKQKPFYHVKDSEELANLSNDRNYNKIPDKIEKIILNLLLISNMILKEYSYIKMIINRLKTDINAKSETISKVKSDIPPKTNPLSFSNITEFIDSLIDNKEKSEIVEDKNKEELKKSLDKLDSDKTLIDNLLDETSNELRNEETDEESEEESEEDSDESEEESDEEQLDNKDILKTDGNYKLKFFD